MKTNSMNNIANKIIENSRLVDCEKNSRAHYRSIILTQRCILIRFKYSKGSSTYNLCKESHSKQWSMNIKKEATNSFSRKQKILS